MAYLGNNLIKFCSSLSSTSKTRYRKWSGKRGRTENASLASRMHTLWRLQIRRSGQLAQWDWRTYEWLLATAMSVRIWRRQTVLAEDQGEFLDKFSSGRSDFVAITLNGQSITVSGRTAIVRHQLDATTNDSGKPGEVHLKVMLVWKRSASGWKLLARQAVRLQPQ